MTTYLSRLMLDNQSHQVRDDLRDCYRTHQRVLSAYAGLDPSRSTPSARAAYGILYRLETLEDAPNLSRLLVQSQKRPDWTLMPSQYMVNAENNPSIRTIDQEYDKLKLGMQLQFRLKAAPTMDKARGQAQAGKRMPLTSRDDQLEWLRKRSQTNGFELLDLELTQLSMLHGTKGRNKLSFTSVIFEGVLSISDVARFRAALDNGMGHARAFGFGLLSIAS